MGKQDGNLRETFPKIGAVCQISSCKKTKGGVDLRFEDLQITGSQFEQVSDWIDDEAVLTLTIELFQGNLLSPAPEKSKSSRKSKKGMAETVAATED